MSPTGWTIKKLADVLNIQNGYAFSSDLFSKNEGKPLIRIRDLKVGTATEGYFLGSYDDSYIVRNGDYLIGMDGEFRCYKWQGPDALLNQRVCRLHSFNDDVDPEFIYYAINDHLREIERNTNYSTVKHISAKQIKAIEIAFPILSEQQRIVSKVKDLLSNVEEVLALREESLKEAAVLESAVFYEFIVDYIKKNPSSKAVPLSRIITKAQYGTSVKANSNGKGVPILRMGNIKDGHLDLSDIKHIDLPINEQKKYLLNEGDILFNRTNSFELVGKAATVTGLDGDWVFASYLVRLEVDRNKVLPEYITALINGRIGRDFVNRTARRAIGMVNINAKQIQQLEVPLPPLKDQEDLVVKMKEARAASISIIDDLSLEPIKTLPSAILHKAFAGEL